MVWVLSSTASERATTLGRGFVQSAAFSLAQRPKAGDSLDLPLDQPQNLSQTTTCKSVVVVAQYEACTTSGFDCMLKQLVHQHYAMHLTLFVEISQRSTEHEHSTCSQTQKWCKPRSLFQQVQMTSHPGAKCWGQMLVLRLVAFCAMFQPLQSLAVLATSIRPSTQKYESSVVDGCCSWSLFGR